MPPQASSAARAIRQRSSGWVRQRDQRRLVRPVLDVLPLHPAGGVAGQPIEHLARIAARAGRTPAGSASGQHVHRVQLQQPHGVDDLADVPGGDPRRPAAARRSPARPARSGGRRRRSGQQLRHPAIAPRRLRQSRPPDVRSGRIRRRRLVSATGMRRCGRDRIPQAPRRARRRLAVPDRRACCAFAEAAILIGMVLPGETALLVAGYFCHEGVLRLSIMIPLAIVAAIAGDSVGFEFGRKFGPGLRGSRLGRLGRRAALEHGRRVPAPARRQGGAARPADRGAAGADALDGRHERDALPDLPALERARRDASGAAAASCSAGRSPRRCTGSSST